VFLITYFIGSFWFICVKYINTEADVESGHTFISQFKLNDLWITDGYCGVEACKTFVSECFASYDLNRCISEDHRTLSPFKDGPFNCVALATKPSKVDGVLPPSFDMQKYNRNQDLFKSENFCCESMTWRNQNCQDVFTQLIIVCYFALTTLSTVGYGDLYPISMIEMLLGIVVMLVGIVFFSKIMGNFIEIIQDYDRRMGSEDKGSELNNWMTLLTRFTNKPLSK
jgi:hypothetical protein